MIRLRFNRQQLFVFCVYSLLLYQLLDILSPSCGDTNRDTEGIEYDNDNLYGGDGYSDGLRHGGDNDSRFVLGDTDTPSNRRLKTISRLLTEYELWQEKMSYAPGVLISPSALPKPSWHSNTSNLDDLFPGANVRAELESSIGVCDIYINVKFNFIFKMSLNYLYICLYTYVYIL